MERWKVVWARINPDLDLEEYKDGRTSCLDPASQEIGGRQGFSQGLSSTPQPQEMSTLRRAARLEFFIQGHPQQIRRQGISVPDKAVQQPPVCKQPPAIQLSVSQALQIKPATQQD